MNRRIFNVIDANVATLARLVNMWYVLGCYSGLEQVRVSTPICVRQRPHDLLTLHA